MGRRSCLAVALDGRTVRDDGRIEREETNELALAYALSDSRRALSSRRGSMSPNSSPNSSSEGGMVPAHVLVPSLTGGGGGGGGGKHHGPIPRTARPRPRYFTGIPIARSRRRYYLSMRPCVACRTSVLSSAGLLDKYAWTSVFSLLPTPCPSPPTPLNPPRSPWTLRPPLEKRENGKAWSILPEDTSWQHVLFMGAMLWSVPLLASGPMQPMRLEHRKPLEADQATTEATTSCLRATAVAALLVNYAS